MDLMRRHFTFAMAIFLVPCSGLLFNVHGSAGTNLPAESNRKVREIRQDVVSFIQRSRTAKTHSDQSDAIMDMCLIYREIVSDQRLARSKELQNYQQQLHRRLTWLKRDLQAKIKKQHAEIRRHLVRNGQKPDKATITKLIENDQPSMDDFNDLADRISQQLTFANQTTGGPTHVFAYASGRWAGPPDNGPALVRLIEDTISPEYWERNGGPGRIHYYKPLMIIVVTANMEVQHDMSRLLKTLRFIGR